ncbi:Golgi-associated RAB2 interactor protein 5B [Sorex fumeus]|uniref:Golgi-associated RAB2 interactor protein 5B n=1 Tax=Sorex fumeus TaxID=62283 RepID=UPI0024AE2F94|nr:Golgi-associated RAB2 interactor protein 5B [Sorex fumeus]
MNRFWKSRFLESLPRTPKWVPILGELQKTLQKGEYLPLGPLPMFESNFVQVTNRGCPVYVHHRPNRVTIGVAASLPGLLLPDLLLIGQPPDREHPSLVLTRMIPLGLAHLYVHELATWRLKLRLVTGRYYYLELDAPSREASFLFNRWIRLIHQLQEPAPAWAPQVDLNLTTAPPSTWRLQDQEDPCKHSAVVLEPTFPFSALASPHRQRKVKTLQRRFRSQAVGDSVPLVWSQKLEEPKTTKKKGEEKASPGVYLPTSQRHVQVSEKHSVTIQTIFSIVSDTINKQSSTKAPRPQGGLPVGPPDDKNISSMGGLVEPSEHCIPPNKHDLSMLGSYDHLNRHLWQQGLEELMDPESSSVTSSSLDQFADSPAFQETKPIPHSHKHLDKGWLSRPLKKTGAPPMRKTPSVPTTFYNAPVLLDQSQKAPAQKALPVSALRKERDLPCPSHKALSMRPVLLKGPEPSEPHRVDAHHKGACYLSNKQKSAFQATSRLWARSRHPEASPPSKACVNQQVLSSNKEDKEQRGKKKGPPEARSKWAPPALRPSPRSVVELEALPPHRGQGQNLEGQNVEGRMGDEALGAPRKTYMDRTGFWPCAQHQKWDKRPVLAVAPLEQGRPFSAEGLAMAKLIIMAQSVDQQTAAPSESTAPYWLSVAHLRAVSMKGQNSLKDRSPRLLTKTVLLASKAQEGNTVSIGTGEDLPRDQGEAPAPPSHARGVAPGPKMPISKAPIPLPQSTWEEVPPTPTSQTPISQLKERVSHFKKGSQGPKPESPQSVVATVGSSSQTFFLRSLTEMHSKTELTTVKETEAQKNEAPESKKELATAKEEMEPQKDESPGQNLGASAPLLHRYLRVGG